MDGAFELLCGGRADEVPTVGAPRCWNEFKAQAKERSEVFVNVASCKVVKCKM